MSHEWNCHLEIFSRPQVIENSKQYLLLRTDILQETVLGYVMRVLLRFKRRFLESYYMNGEHTGYTNANCSANQSRKKCRLLETRLSSHPYDVTLGYISAKMNVLMVFCGLTRSSNRLVKPFCHGESLLIILKRSTSCVRNYPPLFRVQPVHRLYFLCSKSVERG